jgi:cyclopropane-fatty-acyl-phospholipid synthase
MSNQSEVEVSYGLPADFYRLWLDDRMTYTCGVFLDERDDIHQAQLNKLHFLSRLARVERDHHVLDIGCGWGSNLFFQVDELKTARATGITLCREQYEEILRHPRPNVAVACVSYADYRPTDRFDAVISIGMFEHVASSTDKRDGRDVEIYRNYFRLAWEWSKPGAWFGLQSVIGARVPRGKALRELAWGSNTIFPGAITPRLETIVTSASPYWEVMEIHTRREHYAKTSAAWLDRLIRHQAEITERWGRGTFEDYKRYLETCVMVFEQNYQSLAQIALRRIG